MGGGGNSTLYRVITQYKRETFQRKRYLNVNSIIQESSEKIV